MNQLKINRLNKKLHRVYKKYQTIFKIFPSLPVGIGTEDDREEKRAFRAWMVGTLVPIVRLSKCLKVFFPTEFITFPVFLSVLLFKSATLIATPVMVTGI